MKIASSHRRFAADAANSQPSKRENGLRKTKFSPPPVTSVNWRAVDQSVLTGLASSKVGEDKVRSLSTDAVNNIAYSCYSAKDLCFILQGMGYSDTPFPTKKKELIKTILSIRHDDTHLSNVRSAEDTKPSIDLLSTPPSAAAAAAAAADAPLVSVSPIRRRIRDGVGSIKRGGGEEIIDVDEDAQDR